MAPGVGKRRNSSGVTLFTRTSVHCADNTTATYVYGNYIDEVLTMRRGGVDHFYHGDDLYNVMAVTDAAGDVAQAGYGEGVLEEA